MSNDLRRTCRKCGTMWYLTPKEAREKGPNGMQLGGARMQALGSSGLAGGYLAGLEVQKSRVEARDHCPQCGSSDFVQQAPFLGSYPPAPSVAQAVPPTLSHGIASNELRPTIVRGTVMNKIALVKDYSHVHGTGLKEAKDEIERRLASGYYDAPTPPPLSTSPPSDVRACPYCAEEVKAAAIKCKHCGSMIEPVVGAD